MGEELQAQRGAAAAPGARGTLTVRRGPPSTIRVFDAESKDGLGYTTTVTIWCAGQSFSGHTDATGAVTFPIPEGVASISVSRPGYVSVRVDRNVGAAGSVFPIGLETAQAKPPPPPPTRMRDVTPGLLFPPPPLAAPPPPPTRMRDVTPGLMFPPPQEPEEKVYVWERTKGEPHLVLVTPDEARRRAKAEVQETIDGIRKQVDGEFDEYTYAIKRELKDSTRASPQCSTATERLMESRGQRGVGGVLAKGPRREPTVPSPATGERPAPDGDACPS